MVSINTKKIEAAKLLPMVHPFIKDSDVDFLIEPLEEADEPDPAFRRKILGGLYYALSDLLHRKVDMVAKRSLTNKYFIQEVNLTAVPIYG